MYPIRSCHAVLTMLVCSLVGKNAVLDTKQQKTLEMALVGYAARLEEICQRIALIENELRVYKKAHRPKYRMSVKARKRVSEAQKKRWQEYRKNRKNHK